jgi:hypothetical protein
MNTNKLWHRALTFSAEAGCVIVLRAVKLSGGGMPAVDEAWQIVTEKTIAMGETSVRAMQGKRPLALVFPPTPPFCAGSRVPCGSPNENRVRHDAERDARAGWG